MNVAEKEGFDALLLCKIACPHSLRSLRILGYEHAV